MQNKQAKIQTVILIILTLLVAVYLVKLFAMDKRIGETREYVVEQSELVENTVQEPKAEEPKIAQPAPQPLDPVITFLKGLVALYPNAVINECHWADGRQFMLKKDYRIADGEVVLYSSSGAIMDTCPTFYDPETYEPSGMCQAIVGGCTDIVYGNIGTGFVDVYNLN